MRNQREGAVKIKWIQNTASPRFQRPVGWMMQHWTWEQLGEGQEKK